MAKKQHFKLDLKDIKRNLNRALQIWKTQAKVEAPVDTGDLKRSIRTKVEQKTKSIEGTIYNDRSLLQKSGRRKKADVKYPIYVHKGHRTRLGKGENKKRVGRNRVKANRYFDRSYKAVESKMNDLLLNFDVKLKGW